MKIFIFILAAFFVFADSAKSELLFKPLTANTFEPRVGSFFEFGEKKLRLDIGTSVDLAKFNLSENQKLNLGADFFTYTRLRSEGNFKFPVETSDYFFGVNGSYKTLLAGYPLFARLRAAHISSHLVDGLAKDTTFSRMPFVYSREFLTLTFAMELPLVRVYAGGEYVFSTKPKTPEPISPHCGFDFNEPITSWMNLIGGYDFKLVGFDGVYSGQNTAQLGLLLKTGENLGVMLNLNGFSGKSIHGMFFLQNDSYIGLGFQLYFY